MVALLFGGAAGAEAQASVLFVVIDDLRPGLGDCGDPVAITLHIDRIAA